MRGFTPRQEAAAQGRQWSIGHDLRPWIRACYSFRRVVDNSTGALMQVRRSSGGGLADIRPYQDRYLDRAAYLAHVVSPSLYGSCKTWYDQSGNGHHIVSSSEGAFLSYNTSTPCWEVLHSDGGVTTGNNDFPSGILTGLTEASFCAVYGNQGDGGWGRLSDTSSNTHTPFSDGHAYDSFAATARQQFTGYSSDPPGSVSTADYATKLHNLVNTGTTLALWKNGRKVGSTATGLTFDASPTNRRLFNFVNGGTARVELREIIIFTRALNERERAAAEAEQHAAFCGFGKVRYGASATVIGPTVLAPGHAHRNSYPVA